MKQSGTKMKQSTDNEIVVCTRSYIDIPFLHATENGNLYRSQCEKNGRFMHPIKLTVTLNGCAKRIKHLGKVYYFSELREKAFKEKTVINMKRNYCDNSMPF